MSHNPRATVKTSIQYVSVSHRGCQVIHDSLLCNKSQITRPLYTTTAQCTLDDQLQVYGDNSYRYDDDGYLIEKVTPDGSTTYDYGTLGELLEVQTPTQTITYKHNANNQRVAKLVDNQVVEKYLWLNLTTLLAIYDRDDNLIQRYEYANSRMPIAMTTADNTKYYLHYDQVGSLRAITDTNHNIVKEITYDTFGNILSDSNPTLKIPFRFAGGLYDIDTKLTRFGYRDYDSFTGKWTAKDPIGFDGGDSNLYGYVLGDPVGLVDPMGLELEINLFDKSDPLYKTANNYSQSNYPNSFKIGGHGTAGWIDIRKSGLSLEDIAKKLKNSSKEYGLLIVCSQGEESREALANDVQTLSNLSGKSIQYSYGDVYWWDGLHPISLRGWKYANPQK